MPLLEQIEAERYQDLLADEPCGCPACDDGVQPGHFACSQPSEIMLRLERINASISRVYDDGWRWIYMPPA